jgi:hypothetical protein
MWMPSAKNLKSQKNIIFFYTSNSEKFELVPNGFADIAEAGES